ncbi:unnamed protein product [Rhodiola kirilowii]
MSTKQYSVWPVMVTPYNLPPWLCMKTRFIWLTILMPGPSNPKKCLEIYLKPLIDDLVHLWNVGVDTYDANRKQSFTLRAALKCNVIGVVNTRKIWLPLLYGLHKDVHVEERKKSVVFWPSQTIYIRKSSISG